MSPADSSAWVSSSLANVTCSEDTPARRAISTRPPINAARNCGPSALGRTSNRGPGTGVKGTATCSFG